MRYLKASYVPTNPPTDLRAVLATRKAFAQGAARVVAENFGNVLCPFFGLLSVHHYPNSLFQIAPEACI